MEMGGREGNLVCWLCDLLLSIQINTDCKLKRRGESAQNKPRIEVEDVARQVNESEAEDIIESSADYPTPH